VSPYSAVRVLAKLTSPASAPILSHTYTSRPLSAAHLLPLYLDHPPPRPNLVYLPTTSPPTLVFSLTHGTLLFLLTTSSELEPLLALEFLHRTADAFEDFLGAPLTAARIEAAYDVAAQLLTEMCDAGLVATTEPNALRDVVEVEGLAAKLLGSISLPGKPPGALGIGSGGGSGHGAAALLQQNAAAVPWRRAGVRHTSNEMYADVVESLSVTLAPSGRPLAAFANGTIAFTAKVSGVPDILLTLTGPAGKHNLAGLVELPVFHPCVRLSRWKERPGELSFVPPDGRFILAGYEVDLMPAAGAGAGGWTGESLRLPANIEVKTGLGALGSEFEVRVNVNKMFAVSAAPAGPRGGGASGRPFGGPQAGTLGSPLLEDLKITVPLPPEVRNVPELRPSRGDAAYSPSDKTLEWSIPAKDVASGTSYFGLRCTVAGPPSDEEQEVDSDPTGFGFKEYTYDEPYQSAAAAPKADKASEAEGEDKEARRVAQNKMLMPTSAAVSFSVKGWLPSGIKVESILLDTKKSRGLGEGVKPYKGVKYLTISKGGVEIRC